MAPRKPIAESPNMPPEARPSSVGLMPPACAAPGFSDITTTPAVAIRMASASGGVTASPSRTRPNSATCTGSVLI